MALFQKSVLKKYLQALDQEQVKQAYEQFKAYFGNNAIQYHIKNSKEEEFQEGFLRELFVKILGYTIKPNEDYNLVTEQKNEADSKKADGAILLDGKIKGVIELKGTNTIDLNKIQTQAFGYLSAQPDALYVVTSNFEKLRFYIQKSNEYEEFHLFFLTLEQFQLLYLCLSYQSMKIDLPLRIKNESILEEENITKKLYKDYSTFKDELYHSLIALNPQYDQLTLFKASQKLIDRFLFIFFCEDNNGLLPANSIGEIIAHWNKMREMDEYRPLYTIFKKYFEYINTGRPETADKQEIFAFNGGLFATDDLLDSIRIDDTLLYTNTLRLTKYDFVSEVDVNILGHIFENSLNDLEEVQAKIEGTVVDANKTKRKKDGVFYTPKYITEYIIENTVGVLCEQKKTELNINDDEFASAKTAAQRKPLLAKLNAYKTFLSELTICDPACGSGAFLNQAFVFLLKEHTYVAELDSKLFDVITPFVDVTSDILEHNLYGVDINQESVEIAKLSLWLRTAKKGRKLNSLSNNIKCGNSLIDDAAVAGDAAFNWQEEFPHVFAKGGFDVVIGNPPYGAKLDSEVQNYLNKKYIKGGSETVISFTKMSYDSLLSENGKFGFIIPKSFTFSSNYASIREYLFDNISEIIDCKKVWKEVLLEQIILFFTKHEKTKEYTSGKLIGESILKVGKINKTSFNEFGFYLNDISNSELEIGLKVKRSNFYINDIAKNSRGGIFQKEIAEVGDTTVLGGAEIQRHGIVGEKGKINKSVIADDSKCFINKNSVLVQNLVAHIENPTDHIKITACIPDKFDYAIVDTINQITFEQRYDSKIFWVLFNSQLINWFAYRFIFAKAIRTMHFDNSITSRIPIPKEIDQKSFSIRANLMLELLQLLQEKSDRFQRTIQRRFEVEKMSKKLQEWYKLTYTEFVKELAKQKVKLSLAQEAEWEDYFTTEAKAALEVQHKIDVTDKEIDAMVYALYGLTEEEIKIVEYGNL